MTDSPPALSVLLPTQAKNLGYLDEALQSIFAQTFGDFEILLLFDGVSRERAQEVLAPYNDPRLRPVVSERHRGLPRMLNLGARLARAPYLARMDDDDRCLPTRFERQLEVIRDGTADVVGTWGWMIDEEGNRREGKLMNGVPTQPIHPLTFVKGGVFIHPSVMMRRDWLLKHRYDTIWPYGEDKELWIRASPSSHYATVREVLLEYRMSEKVKPVRMEGVRNSYYLVWCYRRQLGLWVPVLMMINGVRQAYYWIRIRRRKV